MQKIPKNYGKPWTKKDIDLLKQLAKKNTPTRLIALELGRTEGSVYTKANELGIILKPTNQSPYGNK